MSRPDQLQPTSATGDDLAWIAFLYVSAELAPELAEEFETRLAADQEAREAVAQAVELSHAAAATLRRCELSQPFQPQPFQPQPCQPQPAESQLAESQLAESQLAASQPCAAPASQAAPWGQRIAWMACGGMACLALVAVWHFAARDAGVPSDPAARGSHPTPQLAKLWSESRAAAPFSSLEVFADGVDPLAGSPAEELVLTDALTDALAEETPSWLLAAVLAPGSDSSADEQMPDDMPRHRPGAPAMGEPALPYHHSQEG